MHAGLAYLNPALQVQSLAVRNAFADPPCYFEGMETTRHAWHLKAWLKALGKTQADLEKDAGMNKAKVSLLCNNKQQYDQDDISLIAEYLEIAPYELLMHPSEAMAIRDFRASAARVAGNAPDDDPTPPDDFGSIKFAPPPPKPKRRTGTHG